MAPNTNDSKKKRSPKQLAALIGAAALAALYLITLLTALFSPAGSGRLFQACLAATVAIPLLIWIYIWMYGKLSQKHTMADFDLGRDPDKKAEEKDRSGGREEE